MLVSIFLDAAAPMEELEEYEIYCVNVTERNLNAVFVYKGWSNEQALQASLARSSTQKVMKRARPISTVMENIYTRNPIGGKGI